MKKYITTTEEETAALGKGFAESLVPGSIVALNGDLGCGKTAFVKGIVSCFGNPDEVSSPTYTLVNEYTGSLPIYHFDVYRLKNPPYEQCDWMDDYFFSEGISLIEWADNIKDILPENTITVNFKKLREKGDSYREITIENFSNRKG